MTSAVWRLAHLTLAIFSFLFLIIASITGTILAIDAINEKTASYKVDRFDEITLSESIPVLKERYPELLELRVDYNQFVTLEAFDEEGNDIRVYIDPATAEILGVPESKSEFIQWTTSLHRSLFLHETGRFIVGFVSFLLFLIAVSGIVLIVKRQQGILHFFSKINKDFFAQYFHVVAGRWLLLPIIVLSATGSYLFLLRFDVISQPETEEAIADEVETDDKAIGGNPADFEVFKEVYLKSIEKIEFPFDDDPSEYYKIKFKDKELIISQIDGSVLRETVYPKTAVWETISLDLHTGRTNVFWAGILALASINILFFIYSGFVITFKRKAVRIRNTFKASEATHVLLVGSENGSTYHFADKILKQLLADGKKAFIADLNKYQLFDKATHLIVLTSTYGLGNAPHNASRFLSLIKETEPSQRLHFSVVGFGSKGYKDFCAFAVDVDQALAKHSGFERQLPLYTINDKSPDSFAYWAKEWSAVNKIALATAPAVYAEKLPKMKPLKVMHVSQVADEDQVFEVLLKTNQKFQSGDLLVIYPANDHRERFYSIGKQKGLIRLVVKLHDLGLGSQYLYQLQLGTSFKARIMENTSFHLPKKSRQILMIANGTGIAPFLGMIEENTRKRTIRLYAGFRKNNHTTSVYQRWAVEQKAQGRLEDFKIAFSRESKRQYVMHLLEENADDVAQILSSGGIIMICGALAMQNDVEKVIECICSEYRLASLSYYKEKGQIKTDCY